MIISTVSRRIWWCVGCSYKHGGGDDDGEDDDDGCVQDRIVEMTLDKEYDVAVQAIKLVINVLRLFLSLSLSLWCFVIICQLTFPLSLLSAVLSFPPVGTFPGVSSVGVVPECLGDQAGQQGQLPWQFLSTLCCLLTLFCVAELAHLLSQCSVFLSLSLSPSLSLSLNFFSNSVLIFHYMNVTRRVWI